MNMQIATEDIRLFSGMEKAILATGLERASGNQWQGTLNNLQHKGVSRVEIDWSGLPQWLSDRENQRVSVRDLLAATKQDCRVQLQRLITNDYLPAPRYRGIRRPDLPPAPKRQGKYREFIFLEVEERSFGLKIFRHIESTDAQGSLLPRYHYWTVQVPRGKRAFSGRRDQRKFPTIQTALHHGRELIRLYGRNMAAKGFVGPAKAYNKFERYALPDGHNYTEWMITAPEMPVQYFGPHFDLANIIAHVRTTDRESPPHGRILVLEEIQSDWNQGIRDAADSLRHTGLPSAELYARGHDIPPPNPFQNHWLDVALRMMLALAARDGFHGIAWLPGRVHAERFPWAVAPGLEHFYDQIVTNAVTRLSTTWGEPVTRIDIPTLTQHYVVEPRPGRSLWDVVRRGDGQEVKQFADPTAAAEYCRSMEAPAVENVFAVLIDTTMRRDINRHGFPVLGSAGLHTEKGK